MAAPDYEFLSTTVRNSRKLIANYKERSSYSPNFLGKTAVNGTALADTLNRLDSLESTIAAADRGSYHRAKPTVG